MFENTNQPILVMGMHRSGTSIVAEILDALGVNMGRFMDTNHEPMTHIALNNWILRQAGTTWEYPTDIERLYSSEKALDAVRGSIRGATERSIIKSVHMSTNKNQVWGWKDPRNTATLPVWLNIYPGAKVIYVRRHGVPVASSLCARRNKFENSKLRIWHKVLTPMKPGPGMGSRLWTIDGAFDMWEDYCNLGEKWINTLDFDTHTVVYEELLGDPESAIASIADFIGSFSRESDVAKANTLVKVTSPYGWRKKPELAELEKKYSSRLAKLGYGSSQ